MDSAIISGIVASVVVGAAEGWRRLSTTKALAAAGDASEGRTRNLGGNLGPRVQALERELAEVRGSLAVLMSGNRPLVSPPERGTGAVPTASTEADTPVD